MNIDIKMFIKILVEISSIFDAILIKSPSKARYSSVF